MSLYIDGTGTEVEIICPANQEICIIKSDLYEKLSDEAKEVIDIILRAPEELWRFNIVSKDGMWRQRHGDNTHYLKCYFRILWGSRLLVQRVFKELETFIKLIN